MIDSLVEKFLGLPFVKGEFDCYDLAVAWYGAMGHSIPDYRHDRYWQGEKVELQDYFQLWRKLEENETPKTHDGIFMENAFGNRFHIGIVTKDGLFIHCGKHGVVQDRIKKYRRAIKGFYRLRALDG